MTPHQRLLHETIIRALQMVVNAWKAYLKEQGTPQELAQQNPAFEDSAPPPPQA